MEYLMTYGWAILIIAVVLGALFQLGVFNSSSFSPRAPPGACQVFRPSGPGTTTNINLMGVCTGQLPQYVAQFNGVNGYVGVLNSGSLTLQTTFTVSFWMNRGLYFSGGCRSLFGKPGSGQLLIYSGQCSAGSTQNAVLIFKYVDSLGASHDGISSGAMSSGTWVHATVSFNNGVVSWYVNGNPTTTSSALPNMAANANTIYIGYGDGYFNGSIANFQLYNTSLSANQVQALYQRGIGGAPSPLQNMVGWWPLNGDVKDYGGNNNNGVPTAVTFTSQYGK